MTRREMTIADAVIFAATITADQEERAFSEFAKADGLGSGRAAAVREIEDRTGVYYSEYTACLADECGYGDQDD